MPSFKSVLVALIAASTTLAGPIVRHGPVQVRRAVMCRDGITADPDPVSLPVPVPGVDEQEDQLDPVQSELEDEDDDSRGLEARQSRTAQQTKTGTRKTVTGGKQRGGGTTAAASRGSSSSGGRTLNPGILNAISAPPLPVSSDRKIPIGILLDRGLEERQSRTARQTKDEQAKGGTTRKGAPASKQGGGGETTTLTLTKPVRITPEIIAQISRPPPLVVTSRKKKSDISLGPGPQVSKAATR
ncbi:hypothetical protein PpBr36_03836 [Pyricularia pennisetigena]|uniref:hypothetical protein n=1 Tax=Pyricularia pennisetigena TaxID=1578925 RepID=UPI0011547837|nr:hypothetical protein PpBr36_03836 [Pyricularia pennisetigena]TLS31164.1 hypothetical protein PpBr36_03836 [Pyricularia pennisetigena]